VIRCQEALSPVCPLLVLMIERWNESKTEGRRYQKKIRSLRWISTRIEDARLALLSLKVDEGQQGKAASPAGILNWFSTESSQG